MNGLALPGRGTDILQDSRQLVTDESRHLHLSKRRSDILLFFPSYICFRHVKRIPHGASIRSIVQIKQIVFEQVFVTFVTSQKRALRVALVFVTSRSFGCRESWRVASIGERAARCGVVARRGRSDASPPAGSTAPRGHRGNYRATEYRPAASILNQTSTVPSLFALLQAFCNCNFLLFLYLILNRLR